MAKKAYVYDGTSFVDLASSTTDLTAYATKAGKLSQFAATTSAELAGVISNETGTGSLVFSAAPTLTGTVTVTPASTGYLQIASPAGNGAYLQVSDTATNVFLITPMAGGVGQTASQFFYNSTADQWKCETDFVVSTKIITVDFEVDNIGAGDSAVTANNVGYYYNDSATGDYSTYSQLLNASYAGIVHRVNKGRASDTTTDFILCYSNTNATADLDFQVRGDGRIASDVATITSPADYAEYFEWVDGNPNAEDRVGIPVVLVGNKIVKATENSEEIIGIVSGRPGFIGDSAWSHWNEKYLIDDFGRRITEDYEVYQWTETDDTGKAKEFGYAFDDHRLQEIELPENYTTVIQQRDKVNPNYNPEVEYVPREDRQEWDAIGLVGKVRMIKGNPVNPRWRKLQDISDTVEEWFIR
jgi:hypothetical protein